MADDSKRLEPGELTVGAFDIEWNEKTKIGPIRYSCAWCGSQPSPEYGFRGRVFLRKTDGKLALDQMTCKVAICTFCHYPTWLFASGQYPVPAPGRSIEHLPEDVGLLFRQVRESLSVNADTLAVMGCRKLLMHIAVDKGLAAQDENERAPSFSKCVEFLKQNVLTHDLKSVLEEVRSVGNDANHEIPSIARESAIRVFAFVSALLILVYELPRSVPSILNSAGEP